MLIYNVEIEMKKPVINFASLLKSVIFVVFSVQMDGFLKCLPIKLREIIAKSIHGNPFSVYPCSCVQGVVWLANVLPQVLFVEHLLGVIFGSKCRTPCNN